MPRAPPPLNATSLAGSVECVTEYFGFAVNEILFRRGVYPADSFQQVGKYGLPLMVSTDGALNAYLASLLRQIALWLAQRQCRVLAVILVDPVTDAVVERWEFTVVDKDTDREIDIHSGSWKSEEAARREVQAVLRQVTACAASLPPLAVPCAFDVVVLTAVEVTNPPPSGEWEASAGSRLVPAGAKVDLRAFATGHHRVDTRVSYQDA